MPESAASLTLDYQALLDYDYIDQHSFRLGLIYRF